MSKHLLYTNVELKFLIVFTALCKVMGSEEIGTCCQIYTLFPRKFNFL